MSVFNDVLPPLSGGRINQFGQFEEMLEQVRSLGLVSDVPADRESTFDVPSQKIRLQAVSTRLYLLGYLPRKIQPKNIHKKLEEIRRAVLDFQIDAGLKPDEWVGNKTWYALEELVAFESDFTLENWFRGKKIDSSKEHALHRAIQLRLWSLGLYKSKPAKGFKLLDLKALDKFRQILEIFMINQTAEFGFNYSTLKILFDQDLLSTSIAKRASPDGKKFLLNLSDSSKMRKQQLAESFIVNAAKIELWLLGFKVPIDGRSDFIYGTDSALYNSLVGYYEKFKQQNRGSAEDLAASITPSLFQSFMGTNEISYAAIRDDDASIMIANQLNTSEKIAKAWNYVSEKGTSLWDGLKRVWRWVKRIGEKAISFVTGNLYKSFFRIASKGFKIVKTGISRVVASIDVYLKGGFSTPTSIIKISPDIDTTVFIKKEATYNDNRNTSELIIKQSKTFNISCRIIAVVFDLLKAAIAGIAGWAKLLFSLTKDYTKLKSLYSDFKTLSTT